MGYGAKILFLVPPTIFSTSPPSSFTIIMEAITDFPSFTVEPQILRACSLVLSISGAAESLENLLDDTEALMQGGVLAEDWSSNVALFLRMRGMRDQVLDRGLLGLVSAR